MYSPTMQRVITALAAAHKLDLSRPGAHLRLEMLFFMPLVIEVLAADRISVTHYRRGGGDLIADPDIEFRVTPEGWVPLAMQDTLGYRRPDVDHLQHRSLVLFCEFWALNIERQKWLEFGRRPDGEAPALAAD